MRIMKHRYLAFLVILLVGSSAYMVWASDHEVSVAVTDESGVAVSDALVFGLWSGAKAPGEGWGNGSQKRTEGKTEENGQVTLRDWKHITFPLLMSCVA